VKMHGPTNPTFKFILKPTSTAALSYDHICLLKQRTQTVGSKNCNASKWKMAPLLPYEM
jgi:hypothetical protein